MQKSRGIGVSWCLRAFLCPDGVRKIGPTIVSKPGPVNATMSQLLWQSWSQTKVARGKPLDSRLEFAILTRESQF